MENRFGFKDFVLATLVVLLILVVWLGMVQLNRQGMVLQTIKDNNDTLSNQMADLQRTLSSGVAVSVGTAGPTTTTAAEQYPHGDPFAYLKAAEKQPHFARGDWIIDNFGTKLKSLTYPVASDLYSAWLQGRVLEGLIYMDPETLEYRPQLARDWHVSKDGMVLTFILRKGVLFSDGTPMTADDVVYSFEFLLNPKINCPRLRGYLENIKSVKKKDDETIVFTMGKPYYESLDLCGTLTVVSKKFMSKFTEEEINTNPGLILGTGPYRMPDPRNWRPGQKIELIRNELYWGVAPTFNRCVFLEVEEEAAEETMFKNGELDVYGPPPEQYKRLLADPRTATYANHYEYESPMNGYSFIAWNEKRGGKETLFSDKRVRRAMTMLTDRQRICHDVFLDYAKPTSGPFAANSPQANPDVKLWPYDVAAAKELLAEAGFKDRDGSGVLKNEKGDPFRFRLTYGANNATFERVVLFLKDSYAKAGITMEQDPVDWPILQKKLDQRDFDAISLGWSGSPESDLFQEFDSSQIADQGDDFTSYSDPKFDAVVEQARITVDRPARMKLWHEAHAILHDDQPFTFLFSRMSLRFMAKRIENVHRSKLGLNYIYIMSMPDPWYVPKTLQKYKSR